MRRQLDELQQSIQEVESTAAAGSEDDWGVTYPTCEAIDAAKQFLSFAYNRLQSTAIQPIDVASLPNEGIELVWQKDNRRIDIIFESTGEISYLVVEETGQLPRMEERHSVSQGAAIEKLLNVLQ